MGYEILSDDLFDEGSKKKPKRSETKKNSSSGSKSKSFKINPLYIHIILVAVVFILLILFFASDVTFFKKELQEDKVLLVGDLKYFKESYMGDFQTYVSKGVLSTRNGEFDIKSSDLEIEGFKGEIYLFNDSINVNGSAKRISYDRNVLNLQDENFSLSSYGKTNVDLFFKTLSLDFQEGRIKLNEEFNYEFSNTTIILSNFNTSFNYDGSFSFMGNASDFKLESKDPAMIINYKND